MSGNKQLEPCKYQRKWFKLLTARPRAWRLALAVALCIGLAFSTYRTHERGRNYYADLRSNTVRNISDGWLESLCGRTVCNFHKFPAALTTVSEAEIAAYQSVGIREILSTARNILGARKRGHRKEPLRILENGCDITGKTSVFAQQLFNASYVGVNCNFNVDFPNTLYAGNSETHFLSTDCTGRLPFRARSFDVVFSDNVLEHVSDIRTYASESWRCLRRGGIAVFRWYPAWDSPRGHHVHTDMVEKWALLKGCTGSEYMNDGSFIADGAHLDMNRSEMRESLRSKLRQCPAVVDDIVRYVYDGVDVNRMSFETTKRHLSAQHWSIHDLSASSTSPHHLVMEKA
jgi:SAM-dependent methyltransferase